jgi:hypothetical protein
VALRLPPHSNRLVAFLFRPRLLVLLLLLLLSAVSASVWWYRAPANDIGLTVERRETPGRGGPLRIERGISSETLNTLLAGSSRPQWVYWRGSIDVPRAGVRGFRLQAKDGAQLFIDGRLAVRATGRDAVTRQTALGAGPHDLELIYEHLEGTAEIQLEWLDADGQRQAIPAAALAPRRIPTAAWVLRRHLPGIGIVLAVSWVLAGAIALGVFAGPPLLRLLELDWLRKDRPFRVILAFSLLVTGYPMWWGMSVAGYWAMDEIGAAAVSYGMNAAYSNGWYDKYPPLHYYIINVILLPFFAAERVGAFSVFDQWVYPIASVLGRAVSIVLGLVSVACVHAAAAATFGRRAGLFAAVIWSTVLPFVYHAKLATLDVPYTAWFALSLLGYVRIIQAARLRDYLLFSIAAVLAVCTKDQAYGLFLLPALHIYYATVRRQAAGDQPRGWTSRLFDRRILWAAGSGALLFALIHNIAFNYEGVIDHFEVITGVASVDYRMYDAGPLGQWLLLVDVAGQTLFCLGWPASAAAVYGLLKSQSGGARHGWLALPAISYYVTFLAVVGYCYDRFLLPVCLVLAVFAGHGVATFLGWTPRRGRRLLLAAVAIALAYTALRAASVNVLMAADGREEAARWLRDHVPAQELVGLCGPQEYNPPVSGRMVHLIPTLEEIQRARPDYVVVNTGYRRRFKRETLEGPAFFGLEEGTLPYRVVHRIRHRAPLATVLTMEDPFSETSHVAHTSLNKLNPELVIYKREVPSH